MNVLTTVKISIGIYSW